MSLRIAVISDTHFIRPPTDFESKWWNCSTHGRMTEVGEALVESVTKLAPDAVIHCGDFTGRDTVENYEFGISFMERLGCPWYGVHGNHDTHYSVTRDKYRDMFDTVYGSWSYSRDIGGMRFFFMDVVNWHGADGVPNPLFDREKYDNGEITGMGPSSKDLMWLEHELRKTERPTVIVTHAPIHFKEAYPLSTLPYGKPTAGPMTPPSGFVSGFVTAAEGRERLYRMTQDYSAVKACLAGHWHINDDVESRGVHYIMTGALREFPYEIRLLEFDGDRISVATHGLDLPELRELSFVKEWGNDWVQGESEVRDFEFTMRSDAQVSDKST